VMDGDEKQKERLLYRRSSLSITGSNLLRWVWLGRWALDELPALVTGGPWPGWVGMRE